MALATFHATPGCNSWLHRPAGWQVKDDGLGGTYKVLVDPHVLYDGESVDIDAFEESWIKAMAPESFTFEEAAPIDDPVPAFDLGALDP